MPRCRLGGRSGGSIDEIEVRSAHTSSNPRVRVEWRQLGRSPSGADAERIDGAPEIPARHGAVRPPALAPFGDGGRRGQLAAEGDRETLADAVVTDRQHVGPAEAE